MVKRRDTENYSLAVADSCDNFFVMGILCQFPCGLLIHIKIKMKENHLFDKT